MWRREVLWQKIKIDPNTKILAGGFRYFVFFPLPGEMIKFDSCFSNGLVQPPTRNPKLIHAEFFFQNMAIPMGGSWDSWRHVSHFGMKFPLKLPINLPPLNRNIISHRTDPWDWYIYLHLYICKYMVNVCDMSHWCHVFVGLEFFFAWWKMVVWVSYGRFCYPVRRWENDHDKPRVIDKLFSKSLRIRINQP